MRVGLVQRLAATRARRLGQSAGCPRGTAQSVVDGLAGGLGSGDLFVEFGEPAPVEPPPFVARGTA